MRRFRKVILFTAVIALVLWRVLPQASEFRQIDTGKEPLCLPLEQKGMFSTPPLFKRLIKGGDVPASNSSFLVTFEPEQVARSVPSYVTEESGMPAKLHARIAYLGEDGLKDSLRGGPFSAGFQLKADHIHVQKVDGQEAYRVSQDPFPEVLLWNVYSLKPEADRPVPENLENYHLGHCVVFTPGNTKCTMDTRVEGYRVTFDANEPNIFLKDQLNDFLADQFQSWRTGCNG